MAKNLEKEPNTTLINDEPLVKMPKGKVFYYMLILYLLYFMDFAARLGINPLYPLIQKSLNLTDTQIGLLGSATLLGMAIFVLPITYLADKWSRSKTVSIMALFWSISNILSGFANGFNSMFVTRLGLGVGEASFAPTSISLITSWYKKSSWGKVLGIFNTSMPLGGFVGSILAGVLAVKFGWRTTLIAFGIPSLILGLLALSIPEIKSKKEGAAEEEEKKISFKTTLSVVLKSKTMVIMTLAYSLAMLVNTGISSWTAMYFVRVMNFDVAKAGVVLGISGLVSTLLFPIGGAWLDRWGKKDVRSHMWIPAICCFLASILFVACFMLKSIPLFILASAMFPLFVTCVAASSQELVPMSYKAVSYGVVIFGVQLFSMAGPTLVGALSEKMGVQFALTVIQIIFVISSIGFIWAGKYFIQDEQKARDDEVGTQISID